MGEAIPQYISSATPVPLSKRIPWYTSTFPTYAGIFLWVGFYLKMGEPTLSFAGVGTCLAALIVAGLLCFGLYYYVPAMLGMQSGQPLYIVGTSTFGTTGGYLLPGLLMGLLQLGWVSVVSSVATDFIMKGLHQDSKLLFSVIVVLWIYILGWVAIKGIQYVASVGRFLNWVPLIMVLVVFFANFHGIAKYQPPTPNASLGFMNVLSICIGYFATAGAAGADFGMNNRSRKDVVLGGLFGIVLGIVVAAGLALLSVAGYHGLHPTETNFDFTVAISSVGSIAPIMFFLFAIASLISTCFSSFIAFNSFSTMLPAIPRMVSALIGLTLCAVLAVTGVAGNLVGFFTLVGASFAPICGAMAADYLLAGCRWRGPYPGINWAGYIAWLLGFLVGIPDHLPIPAAWIKADNPSGLYSFIVSFIVYLVLGKLLIRSNPVPTVAPAN
jgi:cytosine permease